MSSCQGRGVRALLATALLLVLTSGEAAVEELLEELLEERQALARAQLAEPGAWRRWNCDGLTLYFHDDGKTGKVRGAGLPEKFTYFYYRGLILGWSWGEHEDRGIRGYHYSVFLDPATRTARYVSERFSGTYLGDKEKVDALYRNCKGPYRGEGDE